MIRFFKTIQPAALFTIPVLALILWFPGFLRAESPPTTYDSLLLNWVATLPPFVQVIISILLVSLGAVYLNYVINKHDVIYQHSYLPALFYVILMSFHRDVILFHPLLAANLVVIRAFDKTFSLFKNDAPVSPIFDSSFLLAIATLIYFPSFVLFFPFLYAINKLRSFSFREFMIAVVGFTLPFFFLAVYGFWTDSLGSATHNFFARFSLHKIGEGLIATKPLMGFVIFIAILVLLALFRLRKNFYRNAIKTRSTQEILFLFFLFAVGGLFFLPRISLYHFTLLAIPFSVFLAYYFISARKKLWLYEAMLWILFGFIAAGYF
ncbi:MAG: DUF6427 family protein [Bacteroidota bacterium]